MKHSVLALLSIALLGLGGCTVHMSGTLDNSFEILVLHTNDTHSYLAGQDKYGSACFDPASPQCTGGSARLAAAIQNAKASHDNALVLDAGDQFQGTLFYTMNRWPMLADIMPHIGYDAVTLGNHEFDEGCASLAQYLRALPMPVLAANMQAGSTCPLRDVPGIKPYAIRTIKGQKVGIIGLTNPDLPMLSAPCGDMRFADSAETVRRYVTELEKQGVRHIVVLSHLGLSADRQLAQAVNGVDIIVGGHTHSWLASTPDNPAVAAKGAEGPYPVVERSPSGQPVLVVTAKFGASYLGELAVQFDAKGVPASWNGSARLMEASLPLATDVASSVEKYGKTVDVFRTQVLGEHNISYPDGMTACRSGDCLAGMWATDGMLEYGQPYGADVALLTGGMLRAPLPPGVITQGDAITTMPFGNALVIHELSGATLLEALEYSASVAKEKGARLLQPSGISYRFDPDGQPGKQLLSAELVDKDGKRSPIQPDKMYIAVMPDFLSRGGDGYAMFAHAKKIASPESLDIDVFTAFIRAHSPLPMPRDGRIIKQ